MFSITYLRRIKIASTWSIFKIYIYIKSISYTKVAYEALKHKCAWLSQSSNSVRDHYTVLLDCIFSKMFLCFSIWLSNLAIFSCCLISWNIFSYSIPDVSKPCVRNWQSRRCDWESSWGQKKQVRLGQYLVLKFVFTSTILVLNLKRVCFSSVERFVLVR